MQAETFISKPQDNHIDDESYINLSRVKLNQLPMLSRRTVKNVMVGKGRVEKRTNFP